MTAKTHHKDPGTIKTLASYLAGAGAAFGPVAANSAILYFNPEPDLVAIDTDVFTEGGLQQITIDFDYQVTEAGNKSSKDIPIPFVAGVSAFVGPVTDSVGDNQILLRPDDFAGSRVSQAAFIGGANVITTGALGDFSEVTNALFNSGDLIDPSSSWVGRTDTPKKGDPTITAFSIPPADGFGLTTGIGFETLAIDLVPDFGKKDSDFPIDNYGWLRYTSNDTIVVLHDLAIQVEAGVPIEAGAVPAPPALVLLASGVAGLAAFRRQRNQKRHA